MEKGTLSDSKESTLCSGGVLLPSHLHLSCLWPPPQHFLMLKQVECTSAALKCPVGNETASASAVRVQDKCQGFPLQEPGPFLANHPLSSGPKYGNSLQLPCELTALNGIGVNITRGKGQHRNHRCCGWPHCVQTLNGIPTKESDRFLGCFAGSLKPVLKFHHLILPLLKFQENTKFSLISCSEFSTLNWQLSQLLGLH